MALFDNVKTACRVTSSAYDDEIDVLISAALKDLGCTDIAEEHVSDTEAVDDPLIERAVITYCKLNFGYAVMSDSTYDRLKASYDEQKSQLLMSSDYTEWSDSDE